MAHIVRNMVDQDSAEANAIQRLAFAPLRNVYRPTPSAVQTLRQFSLTRIVAVEDEHVIGTVRYRERENRLHLIGLAVSPAHRRRGVARQLVDHLANLARSRDLKELSLYAIEQTGNVPIFEKLGFVVARREVAVDLESVTGQSLTEAFMIRPVD